MCMFSSNVIRSLCSAYRSEEVNYFYFYLLLRGSDVYPSGFIILYKLFFSKRIILMLHFLKENLMNIHGMDEHGEDKMGVGIK